VTRLLGDLRVRVLEVNLQDVGILDRGHVEMLQELDLVHPARNIRGSLLGDLQRVHDLHLVLDVQGLRVIAATVAVPSGALTSMSVVAVYTGVWVIVQATATAMQAAISRQRRTTTRP
jgi:hypothetical protein